MARAAPEEGYCRRRSSLVRRNPWWIILVSVAVTCLVVWVAGRWLLHQFLRLHGGR
jgi:hypothetical protein